MSTKIKKEIQLEIAHVLFIDIVGYSKLSINDQHAAVEELGQIVRQRTSEPWGDVNNRPNLPGAALPAPRFGDSR